MKFLNFKFQIKKAFTLLEMIVVIGIIAVLIGMGSVSYSTAQKKARDAKRKSDLKVIQNTLEQYFSICNFSYPSTLIVGNLPSVIQATTPSCTSTSTLFTVPTDPLGTAYPYQCIGTCNTTAYTICPYVVRGTTYRLETEDCTTVNNSCCLSNQQ